MKKVLKTIFVILKDRKKIKGVEIHYKGSEE